MSHQILINPYIDQSWSNYSFSQIGAESNQAIMLVTDDVPDTYEYTVFQEYNQPHIPVRVFTYLIENSHLDAAKWMACENKGASIHLLFHKHTVFRILLPREEPCGGARAGVEIHPSDGTPHGPA